MNNNSVSVVIPSNWIEATSAEDYYIKIIAAYHSLTSKET